MSNTAVQLTIRQQDIIDIVTAQQPVPISKVKEQLREDVSMPTLNRDIAALVEKKCLLKIGKGWATSYYKPLDNKYQIKESLERMFALVNARDNGFEKALLAVVLISYIQPFEDGNKRTGRMISNALLIAHGVCPLSYRSVDSLDYKKAMLLFYEQNNLSAFKQIFIEQNEFSVKNYFQ